MAIEIIIERGKRWKGNRLMGFGPSPAVARCHCGGEVELSDPLDNQCGQCKRWFNSSGQEVVPSHECDEEGNPYDYDY